MDYINIDNIDNIDSEYAESDALTLTLPENVDMDYFSIQVYAIIQSNEQIGVQNQYSALQLCLLAL